MTRKAISRILFAFACMFVMVFALGMQEPKTVAHAVVNQTERPTYVQQDIVWTNLPAKYGYAIDSGCRDWVKATDRDRSKQTLSLYVTKNTSTSSRTGYVYATLNGKKQYTLTIIQGGHSHIYGGWTITRNATCTYDGSKYCTCHICGQRWTQSIPHLGHSNTPWKVEQQPTCGAAGVEVHTCTRCGYRETRSYGSATGKHVYIEDWSITKQPSCTTNGTEGRHCYLCHQLETRTVGKCGHVYTQINRKDPKKNSLTGITLQCTRCNGITNSIEGKSDVILAYERFNDKEASLYKQAASLLDYKKYNKDYQGNDGVNTYLLCYSIYDEYRSIWNNFIPNNVRHIYDYGHAYEGGNHEFHGCARSMQEILQKNELNRKTKISGSVYIFTCHGGDYVDKDEKTSIQTPDNQFSTLRAYAYLCPNTYVIGVKDCRTDYDGFHMIKFAGRFNNGGYAYMGMDGQVRYLYVPDCSECVIDEDHILPQKSQGYFAAEYFDSSQNSCTKTMKLATSILSTNFLENYL